MWIRISIVSTLLLPAQLAFAQPQCPHNDSGCQVTEHIFTDADQVHGGRLGPEGSRIYTRRRLRPTNLIRIRNHYVNELTKSFENL
jgi:hypothetical protein